MLWTADREAEWERASQRALQQNWNEDRFAPVTIERSELSQADASATRALQTSWVRWATAKLVGFATEPPVALLGSRQEIPPPQDSRNGELLS